MKTWHLLTPEFPPTLGGVSEHSRVLAEAARARGHEVHVWTCGGARSLPGVEVHTTLGGFTPRDLAATAAMLDRFEGPRDLLLQWVPHGFAYRGMNAAFARWIARRAARGDRLDVMVHEPFVEYFGGSWIQPARALVQRYMTRRVLLAARRVWLSIPGWEPRLLPLLGDRGAVLEVLPVPGTIPLDPAPCAVAEIRRQLAKPGGFLVGYFGTGGAYVEDALQHVSRHLAARRPDVRLVCIGRGSEEVAARVQGSMPPSVPRIRATGSLESAPLSHHLAACDALVQPYVDGVSGRRTTTISALEHGVPVATTFGPLSEPFWKETDAVATVAAGQPAALSDAVEMLLAMERHATARAAALALYAARFAPTVALAPLFG